MPLPLLSLIIPMFNEEEGLKILFERLLPCLEAISLDYEVICIDDGSTDATLALLKEYHTKDQRIKILQLSRNFGKEYALSAGLNFASGQAVIPFDADLQDPPEIIEKLVEKWKEGYKIVLATRNRRQGDHWVKRLTAHVFYKGLKRISSVPIPPNTGDFRLMDREVILVLRTLPERTRFMKGIFAWVGFSTAVIYYDRPARSIGTSHLNYRKLWKLALDGIFSFSSVPLHIWTYVGCCISFVAFSYAFFLIIRTLISGIDLPGYASLMTAILFMGGIQLIGIGVLGEYISRIYNETKQRPLYIIENAIGFSFNKEKK